MFSMRLALLECYVHFSVDRNNYCFVNDYLGYFLYECDCLLNLCILKICVLLPDSNIIQ